MPILTKESNVKSLLAVLILIACAASAQATNFSQQFCNHGVQQQQVQFGYQVQQFAAPQVVYGFAQQQQQPQVQFVQAAPPPQVIVIQNDNNRRRRNNGIFNINIGNGNNRRGRR
jgi:membrane-bound lytic murein transglycosylase B